MAESESIGLLVIPQDYKHHFNEVAEVRRDHLLFIQRVFSKMAGCELVRRPIDDCIAIEYFDERPATKTISGVLLMLVLLFIAVNLVLNRVELQLTIIGIGLLALAAVYAVRLTFSSRRHRLVFTMKDGQKLKWASRAGVFETFKPSIDQILQFARSERLLARSAG